MRKPNPSGSEAATNVAATQRLTAPANAASGTPLMRAVSTATDSGNPPGGGWLFRTRGEVTSPPAPSPALASGLASPP